MIAGCYPSAHHNTILYIKSTAVLIIIILYIILINVINIVFILTVCMMYGIDIQYGAMLIISIIICVNVVLQVMFAQYIIVLYIFLNVILVNDQLYTGIVSLIQATNISTFCTCLTVFKQ